MDIKQLSIEGLKAMIYDNMVIIEQNQKNIAILNEELKFRTNNKVIEPAK